MKKRILSLFAALFFLLPLLASSPIHGADATSFDPTRVEVKAKGSGGVPVGMILAWPVGQNPEDMDNWLECNGQSISPSVWPELFAVVGGQVPDLRGLFLRGYGSQAHAQNNGSTVGITSTTHSSGAQGQVQGDGTRNVTGTIGPSIDAGSSGIVYRNGQSGYMLPSAAHYATAFHHIDISRVVPTAEENRPVNTAVRFLVRARP